MMGRVLAMSSIVAVGCASSTPWGRASLLAGQPQRSVEIAVSQHGFSLARVTAHTGETINLIFTRTTERTCAKRIVVSLDADQRIQRDLPVGIPVAVTLHFDRPGELGYSCSMGMYGGVIDVEP